MIISHLIDNFNDFFMGISSMSKSIENIKEYNLYENLSLNNDLCFYFISYYGVWATVMESAPVTQLLKNSLRIQMKTGQVFLCTGYTKLYSVLLWSFLCICDHHRPCIYHTETTPSRNDCYMQAIAKIATGWPYTYSTSNFALLLFFISSLATIFTPVLFSWSSQNQITCNDIWINLHDTNEVGRRCTWMWCNNITPQLCRNSDYIYLHLCWSWS